MHVSIYVGDIADAKADALCTSTNPRLSLVMGTGAAVRERAGSQILRECEAIVQSEGPLAPGSAWATTAGALPHRLLIHCVASDAGHHSSDTIVEACARNALTCAEDGGGKSVAMPVFASGHAHLDLRRSLRAMVRALQGSLASIDDVVLVLHDPDSVPAALEILGDAWEEPIPVTRAPVAEAGAHSWWSEEEW